MKLLLCSDIHCNSEAALAIVAQSAEVEVVIGAGDFANQRKNLCHSIDVLREIACHTILVPGNNESLDELAQACRDWPTAHILHGSGARVAGVDFYGMGGGVPVTPFGSWSYDFTEIQAAELLVDCPHNAVLISHSPPFGAVDVNSSRKNVGSRSVRSAIVQRQLALVVCGHVHECGGQHDRIGETPVVNAGPNGVLWTLDP